MPYEQAFDKIVFRAGLEPEGQFFILDGYARGTHLHYDGNAVLKLSDAGEYRFNCVWKTVDRNSEDLLADGRFVIRRGDNPQVGHRAPRTAEDPGAGSGKAVAASGPADEIRDVRVANLGDGPEVVLVCRGSRLECRTREGDLRWEFGCEDLMRCITVADVDGDGKREILAADHYGSVQVFSADCRRLDSVYSEPGNVAFDVTEPGGKPAVVNGSSTGACAAGMPGERPAWTFDNYGYGAHDVKCIRVEGKPLVLIASATGYVYTLDAEGKPGWQTDPGSPVLALALDSESVTAGCHDGGVRRPNLKGNLLAELPGAAPVPLLRVLPGALIVVDPEQHLSV